MQNQRPFRNDSLDDLYSRARGHWESIHFLRLVLDELGSRTTAAARNLFQEIAEQVIVCLAPGVNLEDPASFTFTKIRPGVRLRPRA